MNGTNNASLQPGHIEVRLMYSSKIAANLPFPRKLPFCAVNKVSELPLKARVVQLSTKLLLIYSQSKIFRRCCFSFNIFTFEAYCLSSLYVSILLCRILLFVRHLTTTKCNYGSLRITVLSCQGESQ